MDRVPVVSSNIREVGFDPGSNTLEVLFADGRVYQYFDVSLSVYEGLLHAASVGRYFHDNIRGVYRFARI